MIEPPKELPTATVAPVLNIKTSTSYSLLAWVLGVAVVIAGLLYLWDLAGDQREEEVVARYEALAITDATEKLNNGAKAEVGFTEAKVEIQTRYVTKNKEIIKYVEAKNNSAATECKLTDEFIRVYNSSGSGSE
jgi:hypothetical protein